MGASKPTVDGYESGEGEAGWDETHPVLDDEHPESKILHFSILHNERNTALSNNCEHM